MRLIDADALTVEEIVERKAMFIDGRRRTTSIHTEVIRPIAIKNAPDVDAVPVIRCKDCVHYSPYEGEEHKGDCLELVGLESCIYEDDFCSYAEPKARDEE